MSRIENENIVTPFEPGNIKYASYELNVGHEIFITSNGDVKRVLDENEQFSIPAGQFALLISSEVVKIPCDAIGLISIKAGVKFSGLVNVSGFHVDPGFEGQLKFAVYNAGSEPIPITQGKPLFMIWFADLDRQTRCMYNGEHAHQNGISDLDVKKNNSKMASPAALDKRLTSIEKTFKYIILIFTTVIATVIATFIVSSMSRKDSPEQTIELSQGRKDNQILELKQNIAGNNQ
nr:hypothetical protein [Geovibrio ferrireducens]